MDISSTLPAAFAATPAAKKTETAAAAGTDFGGLDAKQLKKARDAASGFEQVYLSQMLQQMWSTVKTDGPFSGGHGEEMFRSMMTDQYAEQLGKNGGIGIGDRLLSDMLRLQGMGEHQIDAAVSASQPDAALGISPGATADLKI